MLTHSTDDFHYWQVLQQVPPELISKLRSYLVISINSVAGHSEADIFLLTNDDRLYSYGRNKFGALGHGHSDKVDQPTEIVELREKGVIDLKHGSMHVVALTKDGLIYCWGTNYSGELGRLKSGIEMYKPSLLSIDNQTFIAISCGVWHNVALTNNGKVYVWGENSQAQLGLGHKINQYLPTLHPQLAKHYITKVEAGYYNTVALNDRGELYVWGNNIEKQIGLENDDYYILTPTKFPLPDSFQIKSIICGGNHILLLNNEGELYIIGGKRWENEYRFRKLNVENVRFKAIASHYLSYFSAAMSDTGYCYIVGQLPNNSKNVCQPMKTTLTALSDAFAYYAEHRTTPYLVPFSSKYVFTNSRLQNITDKLLAQLFDKPDHSDFQMVLEGKIIHIHRLVMKIGCRYFEQMLDSEWAKLDRVAIVDYSYSVYYKYLHSLYSGTLAIDRTDTEELIQLLHLAIKYRDDALKFKCFSLLNSLFFNQKFVEIINGKAPFDENLDEFRRKFISEKLS